MLGEHTTIIAAVIGGIFAIVAAVIGALVSKQKGASIRLNSVQLQTPITPNLAAPTQPPIVTQVTQVTQVPLSTLTLYIPQVPIATQPLSTKDREEQQRQYLRSRQHLRTLEPTEEGLTLSVVACGVFGFAQTGLLQQPSYLVIYQKDNGTRFEIHKKRDGSGHLVGFISSETASSLERGDRPISFPVTIFASMVKEELKIVSIPLDMIRPGHSNRRLEQLGARALDIILQ